MNNNILADMCLVHRYLYYVLNEPVLSDYEYDKLEKKALELADENHLIRKPGSSLKSSYPTKIIEMLYENYPSTTL